MNVAELLSFNPEKPIVPSKRKPEDNQTNERKKPRTSDAQAVPEGNEKVLQLMSDESKGTETLDEIAVKKMILQFEKKVYRNQEMRIKFPDLPEKFMESEVELNDAVQELHVLATVPEYYGLLCDLNAVQTLLQLLGHENTDVSIAVVDLLQELTDVDALNEPSDEDRAGSSSGASRLVDSLLEAQIVGQLVQNIERLDESVKEEADGVHNSLAIVENLTEFRPEICPEVSQQGLMQWLLKRIKSKLPFDANKLYASEILAILLQNHDEARQLLGEQDGIDILLQQLNTYKRHDPATNEEFECMENFFNCLCSALMQSSNRDRFMKGEGLQLMNLLLREKKLSRNSAIKVLDHAMIGAEGMDNCQKFVDVLGLRTVFPLFMKTPKTNKKGLSASALEEHIISIVASLLKNCQGQQRQRLLSKFVENDHEKVERLLELHFKYLDKVRACDAALEKERQAMKHSGDDDEDMEDEFYLRRLDAGLFTLQLIDYIMLEICSSSSGVGSTGAQTIKQRVMRILNMKGGSVKTIRYIMREYAGNIGDAKDPEAKEVEQNKILQLVDKF